MGTKERRTREKEQLRRQILSAARELFVNEGYENVSMRKIANKIEYSPTTIYLYFRDKADLLDSVCKETLLDLLNTLGLLNRDKSDPVETLRKSGKAYVEFGLKYPQDYKLTFVVRPQFQQGLGLEEGSVGERVFNYLRAMVSECIRQKAFRRVDVDTAGQALWSAVHGVTLLLIDFSDFPWTEKEKLIDTVIHTMIEGLKA
ncbi:TetR/AcrR family transcriptional regulator [Candidatus Poribacteria bacterium]|nr:MAG: TetR/AcrR family transcriptional regulator [Candidatus Poribacteria bacterium]